MEKLLALEAIRMALTPVMIALPAVFAMLQLLMILLDVSWREMASWLPWGKLFVSILARHGRRGGLLPCLCGENPERYDY